MAHLESRFSMRAMWDLAAHRVHARSAQDPREPQFINFIANIANISPISTISLNLWASEFIYNPTIKMS